MKKFTIVEQVPALAEYTYEVEAENEDEAMELIKERMVDYEEYTLDIIYDDVCLEFDIKVVKEEDIED